MKKIYRVLEDRGFSFLLSDEQGREWTGEARGNLRKAPVEEQPTVGDWVHGLPQPGDWISIEAVEPRMNLLRRQASGGGLQKLGANVDVLWIACALNQDFNLNRLDRYVAMALACEVQPVILLTKADLVEDPVAFLDETAARFSGVDVHALSVTENWNLEALDRYLRRDQTVALMGSSGVGKSTLVNHRLGQNVLETGAIREDDGKGRHTTTHRSLHRLPNGAWLMDTPGLRSLALWDGEEGLEALFADLKVYAEQCRFRDCAHESEPGCRVREALASGVIAPERWASYQKLLAEQAYLRRKVDPVARAEEQKRWKQIHRDLRARTKMKR